MHEQKKTKQKNDDVVPEGAVPAYLLDREGQSRAKVLSNMIKQKRKEKAVSYCFLSVQFTLHRLIDTTLETFNNRPPPPSKVIKPPRCRGLQEVKKKEVTSMRSGQ